MVDASARVRVEMVGVEDVAVDALEFGDLRGRGRTDACAHQGFAHRSDGGDDDFLDAADAVVVVAFDAVGAAGGGEAGTCDPCSNGAINASYITSHFTT